MSDRWHLPKLITERLYLAPVAPADVPLLRAHWNHPWVRLHLFDGQEVSLQTTTELVEREMQREQDERAGLWRIALLTQPGRIDLLMQPGLIGTAGLVRMRPESPLEMLWTLDPRHWHRGYANEAARAVLAYAFDDLGLQRVHAGVDATNLRSLRLAQRLGFRPDDASPLAPVRYFALEQRHWKTMRSLWQAIELRKSASP
jgi:[ribosomal protein S5]-alanine N-acetyltransferase